MYHFDIQGVFCLSDKMGYQGHAHHLPGKDKSLRAHLILSFKPDPGVGIPVALIIPGHLTWQQRQPSCWFYPETEKRNIGRKDFFQILQLIDIL